MLKKSCLGWWGVFISTRILLEIDWIKFLKATACPNRGLENLSSCPGYCTVNTIREDINPRVTYTALNSIRMVSWLKKKQTWNSKIVCVHLLAVELLLDILWTTCWVVYVCVSIYVFVSKKIPNLNKTKKSNISVWSFYRVQNKTITWQYKHSKLISLRPMSPALSFMEKRLLNTVPLSFEKRSVGIKLDW